MNHRDDRFQAPRVTHAARQFQQLGEGRAQGHFKITWIADMPAYGKTLGAATVAHAHAGKPQGAVADDGRDGGKRFRIVDGRGPPVETVGGGERRFEAGQSLLALQGFQQCRFFTADIGPGPQCRVYIHLNI